MTNRYLLEIGTEELPAGFLATAPAELTEKVKAVLTEHHLSYDNVSVMATPRRLALFIDGLPESQPAREVVIKGPPKRVALDAQGHPSPAALGFAKKCGAEYAELQMHRFEENLEDNEEYLVYRKQETGKPATELLAAVLPDLALSLSGSHFMQWSASEIKFSRPIRWLLSLWNNTPLRLQIGDVVSGQITRGHRILSEGALTVPDVDGYLEILAETGKVYVDPAHRKAMILAQLHAGAAELNGSLPENPELLDTVTMLVEYPTVIAGRFEERFLAIPPEVTTTVMASHQKYFPVLNPENQEQLLPYFLTVSNGAPDAVETIRHGNERVLKARLEDAGFFFAEDRKIPLAARVETLKGVTFQKGLGTLYDKTQRLIRLSGVICHALNGGKSLEEKAQRAAYLSKTDLVTGMVRELTELQGVMGKKYAEHDGEDPTVANALFEQYLPRFTGDRVAKAASLEDSAGIILSLADKVDTLVAVFSLKDARLPSGSKDPMGLRRVAMGILQTVLENRLELDLLWLFGVAYDGLEQPTEAKDTVLSRVVEFILQRFRGYLLEQELRYDMIDAVLDENAIRNPLSNLPDAMVRLHHLKELTQQETRLKSIYEPANRIHRILGKRFQPNVNRESIHSDHFNHPSESLLYEKIRSFYERFPAEQSDYGPYLDALSELNPFIEDFFNHVLVNDPNELIQKNRYNLLSLLNILFLRVSCFFKLVI